MLHVFKDDVTMPTSSELTSELSSVPEERKPAILHEANLMQLLADAITYRSSLKDIATIFRCGAKVNAPVKVSTRL
jgi:hypothetical protein